jgi:small conductance mechanosensitive channel
MIHMMFDKGTNIHWLNILIAELQSWWVNSIKYIPNIVLSVLVFFAFYTLAKLIRKILAGLFGRLSDKPAIAQLFASVGYAGVLMMGFIIILEILNLEKAVSSVLAGAGILGLVIGFAFQDLSANFVSGIFIIFRKPFEIGDTVETNGFTGKVEDVHLRSTTLRTFQGIHVIIPNKEIFLKSFINYSRTIERRVDLELTLQANQELEVIAQNIKTAIEKISYINNTKPVQTRYTAIKNNTVTMEIWFWVFNHRDPGYEEARHEAILHIHETLRKNNISTA